MNFLGEQISPELIVHLPCDCLFVYHMKILRCFLLAIAIFKVCEFLGNSYLNFVGIENKKNSLKVLRCKLNKNQLFPCKMFKPINIKLCHLQNNVLRACSVFRHAMRVLTRLLHSQNLVTFLNLPPTFNIYFLCFKKEGMLYQNLQWLGRSGVSCGSRWGGICRKQTSPIKRPYFFGTEDVLELSLINNLKGLQPNL